MPRGTAEGLCMRGSVPFSSPTLGCLVPLWASVGPGLPCLLWGMPRPPEGDTSSRASETKRLEPGRLGSLLDTGCVSHLYLANS